MSARDSHPSHSQPRLPALLADPGGEVGRLWLVGGRIFDGTAMLEDQAVLIQDGRIAAVRVPDGDITDGDAAVIDLGGRTLLPGLVDAHAHLKADFPSVHPGAEPLLDATAHHLVAADLQEALRRGVTTIRDVGSYGDLAFAARQAARYRALRAPRILTCGRIVSATGPGGRFFDGMYREADGPHEVRKAVREQLRRGADFIKVMATGARSVELEDPHPPQMTAEEIGVVVDEAHRQGYRVAAHAEGLAGTEMSIIAGIDTIEHGMYLNQRPDLLERMAQNGQVLVPTLSCFYGVAGLERHIGVGDAASVDECHDFAPYVPRAAEHPPCWAPLLVELARYNLDQADLTLRRARAAGVRIAAGHDWHPLWDLAIEIRRMIAHGLSPLEALTAGTAGAAQALGLEQQVGTVAPGRLADLVAVDGDPLVDPSVLSKRAAIWLVLQGGKPVAGAALEANL